MKVFTIILSMLIGLTCYTQDTLELHYDKETHWYKVVNHDIVLHKFHMSELKSLAWYEGEDGVPILKWYVFWYEQRYNWYKHPKRAELILESRYGEWVSGTYMQENVTYPVIIKLE